jgi:hypothetical protein
MSFSVVMDVSLEWSLLMEGRLLHRQTRVFSVAANRVAGITTVMDFEGLARAIEHGSFGPSSSVYVGCEIHVAGSSRVGLLSVTALISVIGLIFVVVVARVLVLEYMAGQGGLVQRVPRWG